MIALKSQVTSIWGGASMHLIFMYLFSVMCICMCCYDSLIKKVIMLLCYFVKFFVSSAQCSHTVFKSVSCMDHVSCINEGQCHRNLSVTKIEQSSTVDFFCFIHALSSFLLRKLPQSLSVVFVVR